MPFPTRNEPIRTKILFNRTEPKRVAECLALAFSIGVVYADISGIGLGTRTAGWQS